MRSRRGFAYVRVSSDEQLESTLGVRGYIESICRYCDVHGIDLGPETTETIEGQRFASRERIVVESASAFTVPFFKRDGARRILGAIEPQEHLVVAKVERAFRNAEDGLMSFRRMRDEFCLYPHYLDCGGPGVNLDGSTDAGFRAMFGMHLMYAESESRRTSERVVAAHRAARLAGRPATINPVTGFRFEGRGKDRRMVPDPQQLALLRDIAGWMEQGSGFDAVYRALRQRGVKALGRSATDAKRWGDDLRERNVRRWMRMAKMIREIEAATGLRPEAGQPWLTEFYRRQAVQTEAAARRRREKQSRHAKDRLRAEFAADGR